MAEPTEIRTERLLLRPFRLTDADDVYAYASDPEWAPYLPIPSPYEYKHAETHVAMSFLVSWDTHPTFAVSLEDTVIGTVQIRMNADNVTSELGYSIARKHWGKGLMVEAVAAVINWAFEEFDLVKVSARADIQNKQSWRVMEKLGMKREGILRSQEPPNPANPEKRADMVHYGILREEWELQAGR